MHYFCFHFLLATFAAAQYLIESSSFGQGVSISPNNYAIPGWHVSGDGQIPQLLSDKVILTPPYPGNTRGALWSESRVTQADWTAQLDFRATGPDHGGGNLQIWYSRIGRSNIGTSSVYTVGQFDGMVIVVDPYGGQGGGIRGFMNDGSTDFKNNHAVDSLAFGHCDYSYRNLGRLSKLQITQESTKFEVRIDERLCFSSDKIRLRPDYYFGITAASAETPDSFEAYKFLLHTSPSVTREEPRKFEAAPEGADSRGIQETPSDSRTSTYVSSEAQFSDLQSRLQNLAHSIEMLSQDTQHSSHRIETRHQDLARDMVTPDVLNARLSALEQKLDQKLNGVDSTVRAFDQRFSSLQNLLTDSHSSLVESLPKHMSDIITTNGPRMGLLIFIFVIAQVLLTGAYLLYKRRMKQGPKKYL